MEDEHRCGACAHAHQVEAGVVMAPARRGSLIDTAHPLRVAIEGGEAVVLRASRTTFGRSASCDVTLQDPVLSRAQFVVERTADGWRLTDQDSACGTVVDGRRTASALLHEGAEIRVGDLVLTARADRG